MVSTRAHMPLKSMKLGVASCQALLLARRGALRLRVGAERLQTPACRQRRVAATHPVQAAHREAGALELRNLERLAVAVLRGHQLCSAEPALLRLRGLHPRMDPAASPGVSKPPPLHHRRCVPK